MGDGLNASVEVDSLADRFWIGLLELSPINATLLGYEQGMDRLDDPGPEGRARARTLYTETLRDADAVESRVGGMAVIPPEELITLDILRVVCRIELEQLDQRFDRLKVVDQMDGPQTILPLLATFQPTATPEQLDVLLARMADYPRYMAAAADVVREGLAGGLTAARIVTDRVINQLERLAAIPDDESPIVQAVDPARPDDRERLVAAVGKYVRPANRVYLEALLGAYREASREEPGLWSAPHGEELYRTQIRAWTSLDLDAAELHRIGLDELASIEGERRVIARSLGLGDDTAAARAHLKSSTAAIPASIDEFVARAGGQIERAMAAAPRYFGTLPRVGCEVRPVEPYKEADAPAAFYYAPAVDGRHPGVYYLNTFDLPSRRYVGLASMTFHEAVPGHHFQMALQTEHPSLDAFRRMGARVASMAYIEGWGLYSERLADEMGLYLDEIERFGMLDAQSHRAARLVVDTGLHAFHWDRQRAVDQLLEAGLSGTDAATETDRYVCIPGQALCYKTGQREIERLRREAEAALGPAFDVKAFHDAILGHGSLPLATLAKELPGWLGFAR